MPRRESPLDNSDAALSRFAAGLRALREQAGNPTYRQLGASAGYSAATLSEAANGRKLPSLAVTLAYVQACGGDVEDWERRWRELSAPAEPVYDAEAPYPGLAAFQPDDSDFFFGRDELVNELLAQVGARRFVGVFGASGSGKSSLLRAGLVARTAGPVLLFTPGARPLVEISAHVARLLDDSADAVRAELDADPANLRLRLRQAGDPLLVVDQFEEIFTLCPADERAAFIAMLTTGPRVVIGVGADFYGTAHGTPTWWPRCVAGR